MAIPRDEISQPQPDREITKKTIEAIENADYDPTLKELVALAKALGAELKIIIKLPKNSDDNESVIEKILR